MFITAAPRPKTFAIAVICAFASLSVPVSAQTLPPTPPTAMPAASGLPTSTNATAPAVTATRPHRAEVSYSGSRLTVRANDSSLHQILSSISRVTGLQITGGVEEQRVFGNYGPDNASTILATLLDGTGVNMLIREDDEHRPTQLTLTPRAGGAAAAITAQDEEIGNDPVMPAQAAAPQSAPPANLQTTPLPEAVRSAAQSSAQSASQPGTSSPPAMPQPLNNPLGNPNNVTPTASQIPTAQSVSTDSLPTPSTATPAAQGIVDTPNPPAGAAATPAITPDQIYQKLLQMQKDKAAQSAGSSATPPQ